MSDGVQADILIYIFFLLAAVLLAISYSTGDF